MFEEIKKNKLKSMFIVFSFLGIIGIIVYYISLSLGVSAPAAMLFAFIFSLITTGASYFNSDKIILKMSNARPATLEEDRKLVHIFDALMISSGLPARPTLYVIDSPQPNAFATGRNPQHSIVCVTTGLLNLLDYYELEGVIAHEMGHIRNYDILLSCVVSVLVGSLVILSDIFSRGFIRRKSDSDSKASPIFMILGLVLLLLSPLIGKLMQLALSRRREYLADATAAEITRNPEGLISALKKLDSDRHELDSANNATASMYIVNPFKNLDSKKLQSLFSTHPSIESRVNALKNLK